MLAQKYDKTIHINPYEARRYMAESWLLLDDDGEILEDPLTYAKEQIEELNKEKTVEISLITPNALEKLQKELEQAKADMEYIAMVADVEL